MTEELASQTELHSYSYTFDDVSFFAFEKCVLI